MSKEPLQLVEEADAWVLPLAGLEVSQIRIDHAVGLLFENIKVRIETRFAYHKVGEISEFDPEDSASLGPLLQLHGSKVVSATARKDGLLTIEFEEASIAVDPDDRFEAWTVTGGSPASGDGFLLVALPGGGVAVWG